MDVFIVPVGKTRHELYCEPHETQPGTASSPGAGRGLARRFREVLAAAERERHQPSADEPSGWVERRWRGLLRHAAEVIAEQRLLWLLRHERDVTLVHPTDLSDTEARAILRAALTGDRDRHRFWLVVDAALVAVTGPLFFFVPGPNLIAYYFVFRCVGHFLAWRGARQGLGAVTWTLRASAPLAEIRRALHLDPAERDRLVHDIASQLRLRHLAGFVRRTAMPT